MNRCAIHLLQAGSSLGPAAFPALAALILHPQAGPILFDTGYDPAFVEATRPWPERLHRWAAPMTLPAGMSASDQLARFGLTAADIRAVVVSHFHADHIAGLHAFPHAQLYCSRAGLEETRLPGRWARVRRGVLSALAPPGLVRGARVFEDMPLWALSPDLAPFQAGVDLLGDGALMAVHLPGHCVGHWGLAVRGEDGHAFLVGDAARSRAQVRDRGPPPRLATALLGDIDSYRQTLDQLHALSKRAPEVAITPSHCPEAAGEAAAAAVGAGMGPGRPGRS